MMWFGFYSYYSIQENLNIVKIESNNYSFFPLFFWIFSSLFGIERIMLSKYPYRCFNLINAWWVFFSFSIYLFLLLTRAITCLPLAPLQTTNATTVIYFSKNVAVKHHDLTVKIIWVDSYILTHYA